MARIESEGAYGLGRIVETSAAKAALSGTFLTKNRPTSGLITGTDGLPESQGLFDVDGTRDSCGVGFIAHMKGVKSHSIVLDALQVLENLEHRGAAGADPLMGDGAGILVQIPHAFFARETEKLGFTLPAAGNYGIGMLMLSKDDTERQRAIDLTEKAARDEGLIVLGWRAVPVDNSSLSDGVRATEPVIMQVFLGSPTPVTDQDAFERRLYITRKVVSGDVYEADRNGATKRSQNVFYCVSMSCRTVVYKGMFLAYQLAEYYPDLADEDFISALALVHQRFSTNTFPSWKLAHPYRMVSHNGEINTLRGNMNWMYARQSSTSSKLFGDEIEKMWPISYEGQSDTACFDNALEFLVQGGYSLPHAVMTLIPEAWAGNQSMDADRKAFYEYHAAIMEPWDGPAAICFTDGRSIGATLDRNGLRPARYVVTEDDRVILASESGVLPIPEDKIVQKLRLQPGKMLLIDLEAGCIVSDEEIKAQMAKAHPYAEWIKETQLVIEDLPEIPVQAPKALDSLLDLQQAFGYTQEDVKLLLPPMATTGQEAVGSMGTDTPISALSDKSKLLYTYFKQNFAQVTNPPIDPIREELVMSLVSFIGPRPNLFDHAEDAEQKRLYVRQPILTNEDLEKIRAIEKIQDAGFRSITIDITYPVADGAKGMKTALDSICAQAERAVKGFAAGEVYNIIVLSDREIGRDRIAIPALLATAAVHHHLIREGLRTLAGLVIETGEAREIHHFALLAGYGAEAINPYLAFDTLIAMKSQFPATVDEHELVHRFIKSIGKGLLKVMSKMGISTYQSYCGAQIFDAIGLSTAFVKQYFFGTASQIEGVGLDEIAEETVRRHAEAFGDSPILRNALDVGGEYNFRLRGEAHAWTPELIASLQHAARSDGDDASYAKYRREFADIVNAQADHLLTIRGLFEIKSAGDIGRTPISIDEVEPAASIVKRFATGAMSFGSISREAHTTIAIAMNRIGGRSNTGEGGEEADRFKPLANGDSLRSAIKQVASGRFGVSAEYLVNSDQMQIKVAQGAKPGEGGQLPGHKVDAVIAKVRHSTPGVGLISPPPHHDIYSIEDLAQLIFDLKNVNPDGEVSVKLVSEVGVGTVAAGVAKARADHITISGFEGGTGASPLTSLKHAGSPWEIGLAETQQTLVVNGLRSRVRLQVDGGLKTGRDVVMGALLGADEFGFSTAPLIAAGCLMMRKCHLNTCPVGIATQDPVLRKRFKGTPEHVINYFFFIAEEIREILASMGFTKFEEIVGRTDYLTEKASNDHWKARGLNFDKLFHMPSKDEAAIRHTSFQKHPIDDVLDRKLIVEAEKALVARQRVHITSTIKSLNRSVGAMLSGQIAKRFGHAGLAHDTIHVELTGTAGQAFGAFAARGLTLDLIGDANDYVGKGLSGGRLIVRPNPASKIDPSSSIIVGNTVLYGAIEGECYFRGLAGERFAVRNSGAVAVVEGCGDHGCEYMTGGLVVVLGKTGRNFGAGMSGGVAYVLDEEGTFRTRVNMAMVDLEPVPEEEDLLEELHHHGGDLEFKGRVDTNTDMTRHDNERILQLVQNHYQHTGSTRAKEILDNWETFRPKFVKVMPVEYRKALEAMRADRYGIAAE